MNNLFDESPAPTVGRIVHYQEFEENPPLAAIVTAVHDDRKVSLAVFEEEGSITGHSDVPYSKEPREDHWNWPPRV